jgi:hypothetical protein
VLVLHECEDLEEPRRVFLDALTEQGREVCVILGPGGAHTAAETPSFTAYVSSYPR